MGYLDKTTNSLAKDTARLEQEKSFRTTMVYIESVSPDQTRVRCRLTSSNSKINDTIETRLILTPGFYAPINVSNYFGLLHGDIKNPIGVQLIAKATPQPNMKHGLSTGLFGPTGTAAGTQPIGQPVTPTSNVQQYINQQNYPSAQAIIIKPPTPIPVDYIGSNPLIADTLDSLVDDPSAYMSVDESEIRLIADHGTAVVINTQQGISLMGTLNIGSSIQDVRIGGAWRMNPCMQYQIPSSAVSPLPTLVYDPPGQNLTQALQPLITAIIALA